MARSCADLLPPGASIPRLQCFPAMGVTVTAAFCWRDGPAGFLPVGEGPLTVPVVRLRGFPVLQRDHCRLKGAMPSPKAYLVVLLFPGMSYHPRHTCMAIRWHKNAIGTSPGLEPGSRRQSPRSRGNHRGPWGPPHRGAGPPSWLYFSLSSLEETGFFRRKIPGNGPEMAILGSRARIWSIADVENGIISSSAAGVQQG